MAREILIATIALLLVAFVAAAVIRLGLWMATGALAQALTIILGIPWPAH